mgnify:CR=1 FL=1|jgi:hypothetical protein
MARACQVGMGRDTRIRGSATPMWHFNLDLSIIAIEEHTCHESQTRQVHRTVIYSRDRKDAMHDQIYALTPVQAVAIPPV